MVSHRFLAKQLGGDLATNGIISCPGPGHSPKDRSLSVWLEGDEVYVHSFAGDDWRTCKEHVRELLGLASRRGGHGQTGISGLHASERPSDGPEVGDRVAFVRRIWRQARYPRVPLVSDYLKYRGLPPLTDDQVPVFRYHPNCPFGGEHVPALIARFSPIENDPGFGVEPTAIFRIRLDRYDGDRRKLALGSSRGQVIKLDQDISLAGVGITEGIEKGLALIATGWRPVWSTCGTSTMRTFPVLPEVECLTIFCDRDEPGRAAALIGLNRWRDAGREARILAPPPPFKDWDSWYRGDA